MKRILIIAAFIAAISCTKAGEETGRQDAAGGRIVFAAASSKSITESTAATVQAGGFNVVAQVVTVNGRTTYFNDHAEWSASENWFATENDYYFPASPLTFYAVHPKSYEIEFLQGNKGPLPCFSFTSDGVADVISAYRNSVSATDEKVALTFEHILAQVRVLWTGEDPKVTYEVTGIDLQTPRGGTYEFVGHAWSGMTYKTVSMEAGTAISVIPSLQHLRIRWNCLQNGVLIASYDKTVSFTPGIGKICTVNCTLPNADAKTIDFSIEVNPWGTEDQNVTMSAIRRAERAPVSFSVPGVSSLDLCAFRPDGTLDTYARQEGGSITASLTKNMDLSYWLVANAKDGLLDGIATEDGMGNKKAMLSDNDKDALLLVGKGTGRFSGETEEHLDMDRMVCKVSIGKITPSFLGNTHLSNGSVTLDRVYLVNAPGSVPFSGEPSRSDMLNVASMDTSLSANLANLLSASPAIGLGDASPVDLDLSFYCCPNPDENTRLVLELTISGQKNYYPITLPAMRCNYEYRADEVELLGWGSASPDVPVERNALRWAVTVNPWGVEEKNFVIS